MGNIKVMDFSLAGKIAAGEVVENQASVIKELVENSIDAKSDKIEIVLLDTGFQLIQVSDNGIGMSKDDLLICHQEHATSKVYTELDLLKIGTLGFRGEALSSIAAVSKLQISTKQKDGEGYKFDITSNKVSEGYEKKGTCINVYNLFYNVPARLKHLKSQKSELAQIISIVNKFALIYPNISFSLTNDNKVLFETNGKNNLLEIIAKIYTLDIAKNMIEVKSENADFEINGYISSRSATRSNKNGINVFINDRLVKNKNIVNAIIRGYGEYLMERRYPITILNIKCDYQLVDVNVHPSKTEVRISKEDELLLLIEEMIRNEFKLAQKKYINNQKPIQKKMEFEYINKISESNINYPNRSQGSNKNYNDTLKDTLSNTISDKDTHDKKDEVVIKHKVDKSEISEEKQIDEHEIFEEKEIVKVAFNVIGQFNATYILAQNENGLHLIDQHAAMERINYEKKLEKVKQEKITFQELVTPIIIPLSMSEKTKILEFKKQLGELGLNIEQQVNNDITIRNVPSWIDLSKANESIQQTIDYILELKNVRVETIKKDDLILASCKMSLKANHYLSHEEQQVLLDELILTDNYDHCPHGRPIIVSFTVYEIEKMFKRVV